MTLKTDKGKTFEVNWAWAPAGLNDDLMFELANDTRPLSEIAADFEDCERIHRTSEIEPPLETDYDGYTRIRSIVRDFRHKTVQMTLARAEG